SGAVALAVNERGESAHADGWGHWLGDEGSGFDIGRRGLQAALRAMDGRGPQTQLLQRVRRAWGADFTHQIGDLNEDVAQAHRRIAGFAPEVVAAAQAGDCVAVEILRQAGRDLANTGASVLLRAGLLERPQVATIGSVFGHAALLREAFCQALAQLAPGVEVRWPALQPAEGAALLARDPKLVPSDVLVVTGR
ncbi:MAG: ATPase, partial [Caldilineae bacterium]